MVRLKFKRTFVFVLLGSIFIAYFLSTEIKKNLTDDYPYKMILKILKKKPALDSYVNKCLIMPDKFLLHRMNNVESLSDLELLNSYSGVELDIIFFENEKQFEVSHDSKGYVGNPLENHLQKLSNLQSRIWLDYKNLSMGNVFESLQILNDLLKRSNVDKSRIIVEGHDLKALSIYKNDGFYTSYYMPYFNLSEMKESEKEFEKQKLLKISLSKDVSALSFPAYLYDFVKSANVDIDLLTWEPGGEVGRNQWYQTYSDINARKMIYDNQVKIILVGDRRNRDK